jgi:RNA polymerase sigma-B factor
MTTLTVQEQRGGRARTAWDGSDEQMMFARLTELPAGDSGRAGLRAEIARRYLGLVESLAAPYRGRGEPFDDIVGAGRVGLVKAIDRFEPARGNTFVTYATAMIVGEIKRHFRDTTWSVHVPRRLQEMRARLRAARRELAEAGVAEPTQRQLAAHLGVDEREILDASAASNAYSSLSLDTPGGGEDALPLADTMGRRTPIWSGWSTWRRYATFSDGCPIGSAPSSCSASTATRRKARSARSSGCPRCRCPGC